MVLCAVQLVITKTQSVACLALGEQPSKSHALHTLCSLMLLPSTGWFWCGGDDVSTNGAWPGAGVEGASPPLAL